MTVNNIILFRIIRISGAIVALGYLLLSMALCGFIIGIPYFLTMLQFFRFFWLDASEDYEPDYLNKFRAYTCVIVAITMSVSLGLVNTESIIPGLTVIISCYLMYIGAGAKMPDEDNSIDSDRKEVRHPASPQRRVAFWMVEGTGVKGVQEVLQNREANVVASA